MANELSRPYGDGTATLYCIISRPSDMAFRDVVAAAWDAYAVGDWDDYDVQMSHQGGGIFAADMPTGIALGTRLRLQYFLQAGVAPVFADDTPIGSVEGIWTGSIIEPGIGGGGVALVSDARAILVAALAALDDTLRAELLLAASAALVEVYGEIALQDRNDTYDGTGTRELMLDHRPLVTLTSVTIVDDDEVEHVIAGDQFRCKLDDAIIRFKPVVVGDYDYFPDGFQNVRVACSIGYADVPEHVQEAVLLTAAWMAGHDKLDQALQSESLGDYSWTAKGGLAASLPGPVRALMSAHFDVRIA